MDRVYVTLREGVHADSPIVWSGYLTLGPLVEGRALTAIGLPASDRRPDASKPTLLLIEIRESVEERQRYPEHSHDGFLAGEKCPDCGHVFERDYAIGG